MGLVNYIMTLIILLVTQPVPVINGGQLDGSPIYPTLNQMLSHLVLSYAATTYDFRDTSKAHFFV